MMLSIRHAPLKIDIERMNKIKLIKAKEQLFQRVVNIIDQKNVQLIYDVLLHNVKTLKTNDVNLIYNSSKIQRYFGLRIIRQ